MVARFPAVGESLGNFDLIERVGGGGMGVVFRARQRSTGRVVAVKVIVPQFAGDPEYRCRFVREAASMARVESPHVVGIVDHGEIDGCLFLASQFVEGPDLGALLRERGPLTLPDALSVCGQLAEGLHDSHTAGVMHRDIKPGNVLLRDRGGRWHAYLCDLGVAQVQGGEPTGTPTMVGTTAYLAPERIDGAPATPASDVYALGCLLVAALTGDPPFTGSDFAVLEAHRTQPVPQWAETDEAMVRLNTVLRRAMAKDPRDRYASAAEFGQAVDGVLAGSPGTAAVPATQVTSTPRSAEAPVYPTVPAVSLPAQPGAAPRASRWWRTPLIAALVVVLAGAVAATAYVLSQRGEERGPGLSVAASGADRSAPQQVDDAVTSAPASPPAGTSPSAAAQTRTCWYGDTVANVRECRPITGLDGLRWVFPSLARMMDTGPGCRPTSLHSGDGAAKTDAYQCRVRLDDGTTARITYSAFTSAAVLVDHYRSKYGTPVREGDRLRYGPSLIHRPGGRFAHQATYTYHQPRRWGVTALADSPERAVEALSRARMLPYRQICRHIACVSG